MTTVKENTENAPADAADDVEKEMSNLGKCCCILWYTAIAVWFFMVFSHMLFPISAYWFSSVGKFWVYGQIAVLAAAFFYLAYGSIVAWKYTPDRKTLFGIVTDGTAWLYDMGARFLTLRYYPEILILPTVFLMFCFLRGFRLIQDYRVYLHPVAVEGATVTSLLPERSPGTRFCEMGGYRNVRRSVIKHEYCDVVEIKTGSRSIARYLQFDMRNYQITSGEDIPFWVYAEASNPNNMTVSYVIGEHNIKKRFAEVRNIMIEIPAILWIFLRLHIWRAKRDKKKAAAKKLRL